MEKITIFDKRFKIFMPYEDILRAIDKVAERLNSEYGKGEDIPIFLGVLTGSFMFLADLMKRITFPCDVVFIRLSSYEGTSTTGDVKQVMGLTKSVKGRRVVVVEDIVDTGTTITELHKILSDAGAEDVKICTLLFKPDSYKSNVKVDYPAIVVPSKFIVGYGLDYNQMGRQYKDIYVLDTE